ncbi:MAG: hypothetical protein RIS38_926 [Verrucomicrobiota bacterium]
MQIERLIARIRGQLELPAPELEARSLAGEYAALCQRARERLEQCATLARGGNEHAAFQAAEAEPDLLGLCAALSFAESDRWNALCRERGLPAGFALDSQLVQAVDGLYGREIGENHPLYRDYRDAIRRRDEDRALSVLRSIVRINPDDPNARSELARLSAKFLRDALGKVGALFAANDDAAAVELMTKMERFGALELTDEPRWQAALARRVEWLRLKAAEQARASLGAAQAARALGEWESCAGALARVRALGRDLHLDFTTQEAAAIAELENWAGELAAEAEAEASLRATIDDLTSEWARLRQDAARGTAPALLIVRLGAWLERAEARAERLPEGLLSEARALRHNTRTRLNRRYLVQTTAWVAGLLAVVGGMLFFSLQRQQNEAVMGRFSEAKRLLELHDHEAARTALEDFEKAGASAVEREDRQKQTSPLREQLERQLAVEQRLTLEARQLAERQRQGLTPGNLAETKTRAVRYLEEHGAVGETLRRRLDALFPEPTVLAAACEAELDRLRAELETQSSTLAKAIGVEAVVADSKTAVAALDRMRVILKTLTEAKDKDLDSALAQADRAELRLGGERKTATALRALAEAADLSGYLSALAGTIETLAGEKSDLSARAAFVLAQAEPLRALPRPALAPRVGAMWDAAPEADPRGLFQPAKLNEAEQKILRQMADTSVADSLRRATLSLYSIRGVKMGRVVYVAGEITESRTPISDGVQYTQRAKEFSRDGLLVDASWRRQEFNNGVRAGEELTAVNPIPELAFIKDVMRFSDPATGQLLEPPLRLMERVRRSESSYPELRAYQLQEFFRLAGGRPAEWGTLFSPSAQRDAEALRRITQNELRPLDFLFKDKWAHAKEDLRTFLVRQTGVGYADEARFWRATFAALRSRRLIFAGMVSREGRTELRDTLKNTVLYGLNNEGKATVLFTVGADGEIRRVADAAPLSPLLRYPGSVEEAATTAGIPTGLVAPAGGWETLLQGRDL